MHAAVQHVAAISGQIVGYLKDLVRMPTVNPPLTMFMSPAPPSVPLLIKTLPVIVTGPVKVCDV